MPWIWVAFYSSLMDSDSWGSWLFKEEALMDMGFFFFLICIINFDPLVARI